MNTRQTQPGGRKPIAKPLDGKPLSGKPREQQEKNKPSKTIAEATGAPKREEAMLAAASHARAIGSEAQPRHILSAAFESIERSFRAAGFGTLAVNRKLIDIARANLSSGFDLAKDLAGAKTSLEAARLQMAFFDQRMKALAAQAQELRALQAELVEKANEPIREQLKRTRSEE
ncbi:MAG TPA: phasin family protein [Sphingomicrobium sp.]|nr:phasin family protein [Sphingomicrobium sp.]